MGEKGCGGRCHTSEHSPAPCRDILVSVRIIIDTVTMQRQQKKKALRNPTVFRGETHCRDEKLGYVESGPSETLKLREVRNTRKKKRLREKHDGLEKATFMSAEKKGGLLRSRHLPTN